MPDRRPSHDPPWNAEPLTGRSLTMQEYLDAVLTWVDSRYEERRWRTPFADENERRAELRTRIEDAEERSMIRRFADGEPWSAIKASTRGGTVD